MRPIREAKIHRTKKGEKWGNSELTRKVRSIRFDSDRKREVEPRRNKIMEKKEVMEERPKRNLCYHDLARIYVAKRIISIDNINMSWAMMVNEEELEGPSCMDIDPNFETCEEIALRGGVPPEVFQFEKANISVIYQEHMISNYEEIFNAAVANEQSISEAMTSLDPLATLDNLASLATLDNLASLATLDNLASLATLDNVSLLSEISDISEVLEPIDSSAQLTQLDNPAQSIRSLESMQSVEELEEPILVEPVQPVSSRMPQLAASAKQGKQVSKDPKGSIVDSIRLKSSVKPTVKPMEPTKSAKTTVKLESPQQKLVRYNGDSNWKAIGKLLMEEDVPDTVAISNMLIEILFKCINDKEDNIDTISQILLRENVMKRLSTKKADMTKIIDHFISRGHNRNIAYIFPRVDYSAKIVELLNESNMIDAHFYSMITDTKCKLNVDVISNIVALSAFYNGIVRISDKEESHACKILNIFIDLPFHVVEAMLKDTFVIALMTNHTKLATRVIDMDDRYFKLSIKNNGPKLIATAYRYSNISVLKHMVERRPNILRCRDRNGMGASSSHGRCRRCDHEIRFN